MFTHICEMILALGVFYTGIVCISQYSNEYAKTKKAIKKRKSSSLILSFLKSAGITALAADHGKLVTYSASSFCFSGLINFETAFVCILGASLTAGASSFLALINERDFIYIILGFGGLMRLILIKSRQENLKLIAMFIVSVGLLLFGIILIKDNFAFLGKNDYIKHALMTFHNPFLVIFIGTVISFIMQSTAGFTFMIVGLWGGNLVSYEQSILMLYGSCIAWFFRIWIYALPFKGSAKRLMFVSADIILASTIITIGFYFLERATSIPLLNSLLRCVYKNVVLEVSGAMLISTLFIVFLSFIFLKPLVRLYTKRYPEDSDEILSKTHYINNIESLPKNQWPELMNKEIDRIIANFHILVDIESSGTLPNAKAVCNSNDLILDRIIDLHKHMYGGVDSSSSSLQEYWLYEKLFYSNNLNTKLVRYCEIINKCDRSGKNIFVHAVSVHVLFILKCLSDFIYNKANTHEIDIVAESLNFKGRSTRVLDIVKDIKSEHDTKFELAYVYYDILASLSEIVNTYKYSLNAAIPDTRIHEN